MTSLTEWKATGKFLHGTHYFVEPPLSDNTINLKGLPEKYLIVIHGIGGFHVHFEYLSKKLIEILNGGQLKTKYFFRIIRYDLIGRGHSSSSNSYDGDAHVHQLRRLLVDLSIVKEKTSPLSTTELVPPESNGNRFYLLGHSMGGAIASLYIRKYPNEVEKLILFAPAGLMSSPLMSFARYVPFLQPYLKRYWQNLQDKKWDRQLISLEEGNAKNLPQDLHSSNIHDKTNNKISVNAENNNNDLREHAPKNLMQDIIIYKKLQRSSRPETIDVIFQCALDFPLANCHQDVEIFVKQENDLSVLLMWGDRDDVIPISNMENWKTSFLEKEGNIKLKTEVLEGLGHGFFLETPEQTITTLTNFLIDE